MTVDIAARGWRSARWRAWDDEGVTARWARRCVTVPGYLLATIVAVGFSPILVGAALILDARELRRAPRARFAVATIFLLVCEAAGIVGTLVTWALAGGPLGHGSRRAQRLDRKLQRLWARALLEGGRRIFGLGLRVAGNDGVDGSDRVAETTGPILVLARHASLIDSLLPCALLDRFRLRYVLKRELRWDPCLDIVGARLPNAFVRRGSGNPLEIERVAALARDLEPDEGVVLFPEGTRFTTERRRRLIEHLEVEGAAPRLRQAGSLRHTLPPRRGGVLALLDAAPQADVMILVHTGLEGAARLRDLWRGSLHGETVNVELWRFPRATIPEDDAGREAWLDECWRRVDDWVEDRRGKAATATAR